MNQLRIDNCTIGILPDGGKVKPGDYIKTDYWGSIGFTRVVLYVEHLCLEDHYMYGKNISISHFISQNGKVNKCTLSEIYKHCKANEGWNFKYYVEKFKQNAV